MKLYIYSKKNLVVTKETTTQSILSDLFTYGVFVVLFGCGIAFELLVGRSWMIDAAIVALVFAWIFGRSDVKKQEVSKEELKKMIDEL